MALLASTMSNDVGLRLLLSPLGSNVVVRTASCSVGGVLPVYSASASKAIEGTDKDEKQKGLLYWAACGSFSVIESFTDRVLGWVPIYYHMKFAFLVCLKLPTIDVGFAFGKNKKAEEGKNSTKFRQLYINFQVASETSNIQIIKCSYIQVQEQAAKTLYLCEVESEE